MWFCLADHTQPKQVLNWLWSGQRALACLPVLIFLLLCADLSYLSSPPSLPLPSPWTILPAGIKLTLSALLDGKNVNAGGHKLGLGLEFQA